MTKKLSRILALMLAVIMTFSMLLVPVEAASFKDVPNKAWYKAAVDYVYERGWMTGVSSNTFGPNVKVTRAMAVTVLAKLAGAELDGYAPAFEDTKEGAWYTKAAAWAKEMGITAGNGNGFGPNLAVTREQLVTFMYRLQDKQGFNVSVGEADTPIFGDEAAIEPYAVKAVKYCAANAIVSGFEDGSFGPKQTATRAQLALMMMKLDQLRKGQAQPMPAQYFDGEAGDRMFISVYAPEGTLPEDSTMTTSRVTDEAALAAIQEKVNGNVMAAADITFKKDDAEIEPDGEVEVLISLKQVICSDNLRVYHVKADGSVEPVDSELFDIEHQTRAGSDKTVRFFAKDFSVYVVVEEPIFDQEARAAIVFHSVTAVSEDNPKGIVATYYVKNSDQLLGDGERQDNVSYIEDILADPNVDLEDPDENANRGLLFRGWSTKEDYAAADTPMTIQQVSKYLHDNYIGKIKEGDVIDLYAMVFRYFIVTYYGHDTDESSGVDVSLGSDTVLRRLDETTSLYTVNMAFEAESNEKFMGWIVRDGKDANGEDYIDHVNHAKLPKDPDNPDAPQVEYDAEAEPPNNITTETVFPNNTVLTIDGDLVLDVKSPKGRWLIYNENKKGATFNAPDFVLEGDKTEQKPTAIGVDDGGYMDCFGFTFKGWYKLKEGVTLPVNTDAQGNATVTYYDFLDEDGKLKDEYKQYFEEATFEFGYELTEDRTNLYAGWMPKETAPYTVLIWTQNYDSINKDTIVYDLKASYSGVGNVGQAIPFTVHDNDDEDYVTIAGDDYHYTGFCLQWNEDEDAPKLKDRAGEVKNTPLITAEGDAVLNIYFNRIQYNVRFYLYRSSSANSGYSYATRSNAGRNVWNIATGWTNVNNANNLPRMGNAPGANAPRYTVTTTESTVNGYYGHYFTLSAFYGEDIQSKWPTYDEIKGPNNDATKAVSFIMMNGAGLKDNGYNDNGHGDGRDTIKGVITVMDDGILGLTSDANGNFFIVRYANYNDWTYHIYYEVNPDETYPANTTYATRTINGIQKTYYLDHDVQSRSSNTIAANQNPPAYLGFAVEKVTTNGSTRPYQDGYGGNAPREDNITGYTCYLNYYYDRLEYNIQYLDALYVGGNSNTTVLGNHTGDNLNPKDETTNLPKVILEPFGANVNVAKYKDYVPTPHASEKGFVFDGWYADAACTQKYTWDKMPDGGITVYAKWVQIQYRVFLRPNAETEATNAQLNWGSANQQLNFRISYNGHVSTPTGTWTDGKKEFVGWFLDEACENQPFDGQAFALNENFVKDDYDKTDLEHNATDGYDEETRKSVNMDKWGHIKDGTTPYNSDATAFVRDPDQNPDDDVPVETGDLSPRDRYWITKKLEVYGKWRTVLVGATGIDVHYIADGFDETYNGTDEKAVSGYFGEDESTKDIYDEFKYLDKTKCVATAAPTPLSQSVTNPETNETTTTHYQFLYWVIQRWVADESDEGGHFEDVKDETGNLKIVHPADTFNVLEEYSRIEELEGSTAEHPKRSYTFQLRAAYRPDDLATPTHIDWVANGSKFEEASVAGGTKGEEAGVTEEYSADYDIFYQKNLAINEGVAIPEPLTREGYTFLGWARIPLDDAHAKCQIDANEDNEVDLDENGNVKYANPYPYAETELNSNLYVKWDPEFEYTDSETNEQKIGSYVKYFAGENGAEGTWKRVTRVAADEAQPYHVMYAVWKRNVFYVFHSSSGLLQAFEIPINTDTSSSAGSMIGRFDITKLVADGYLYGGYYSNYGGVAEAEVKDAIATLYATENNKWGEGNLLSDNWSEIGELTATNAGYTTFEAYNGSSLKSEMNGKVKFWTKDDAYDKEKLTNLPEGFTATDVNGETMKPQADKVYYLKEVPADKYLHSYYAYVYTEDLHSDPRPRLTLDDVYLLTGVDDTNYRYIGFRTSLEENAEIVNRDVLTPKFTLVQMECVSLGIPAQVNSITALEVCGNQRGYIAVKQMNDLLQEDSFTMLPSWETLDGVKIGNAPKNCTIDNDEVEITGEDVEIEPEKSNLLYVNVKAISWWTNDEAETRVQFYDSNYQAGSDSLVIPTQVGSSNYYCCEIPEGYTKVKIQRYVDGDWKNESVFINLSQTENCIDAFWPDEWPNAEDDGVVWKTFIAKPEE